MSVDWFLDIFQTHGDSEAIIHDDRVSTYRDLLNAIDEWEGKLKSLTIRPGDTVAMVSDFTISACSLLIALIRNDNIIVPLMPVTYARRKEFLDIAGVQHVFKADRDEYAATSSTHKTPNPLVQTLRREHSAGLVLFSSGSTGTPKAALHSLRKFLEKFKTSRPAWRTLSFLLLDHIGGINTFFHTVSNGGTVIATSDRSPEAVCRVSEKYKVELLPVSPTFLNLLLLSEAYTDYDLSSLKVISYGTEPMPQSTLNKLAMEFPDTRLLQTYGLSEVGIFRSRSEANNSLWFKIGGEGFDTKIVDGELWVKSDSSILGYLNHESPFDENGWMNTGDEVEVKGDYIRIKGRKTEMINVGGEKVYPIEVESSLLELSNIEDVIVYGEKNPIIGEIVVATVKLRESEELPLLKSRIRRELSSVLASYMIPQKVIISDGNQYNERFKRMRLMGNHSHSDLQNNGH